MMGWGNAGIPPMKDERVALLKILVGERRGVETEGLLVRHVRRGRCTGACWNRCVACHAELREGAEEGHLSSAIWPVLSTRERRRTLAA